MPFDVCVAYEVGPATLDAATVRALAEAVLIAELAEDGAAVSIVFTDDATVRVLNREHRGVDATTDVLSFGLSEAVENASDDESAPRDSFVLPPDAGLPLGEVVVSLETAARQAAENGRDLRHELAHLVVHGVLHLLGHDHAEPAEEMAMRAAEDAALAACGFPPGAAGWRYAHES